VTGLPDPGPYPDAEGHETALWLDREDPLATHRDRFAITDPDLIYLDGNSLGRLPIDTEQIVVDAVSRQWGDRLIRYWNEGWWDLQLTLGDLIAPILGASPGEVIISDSTSVNLFKLAWAAVAASPNRHTIVTDDLNFPGDIYILDGVANGAGARLVVVESDGINGPVDRIAAALDEGTALLSLSHTTFKSGYTYDLAEITAMAHAVGAMVLWDTSHSVGVVPVDLGDSGADLAVGCTYKYLNGGPGSPAFLYVRRELQPTLQNPITGWWAHNDPFGFDTGFRPVDGIRRFHSGTVPILSMAAIEAGARGVLDAGIDRIRAKSMGLTGFLIEMWETHLEPLGFALASPRDPRHLGSHVSLAHPDGWPIARAMIDLGAVLPDFRAPDNLRLGLSPLYTRFVDVHTAVMRTRRLVESGAHDQFRHVTMTVT
jgi:kynureninase